MGFPHITATEMERKELNLRRFKKIGLQTTHSGGALVTDSAAAATTLATGQKTTRGRVGMTHDKQSIKNVFEYALDAQKGRGIVVTATVNHATPAGFTIHHESRYNYDALADKMVACNLDVMFGGGLSNFLPSSMPGGKRKDGRNLLGELRRRMPVVQTIDAFRRMGTPKKAAALLADIHLPNAVDRDYSLGELTKKAIEILNRNENGFLLMVEGSKIDLVAHKHLYDEILNETVDFDTAVKEALDFAQLDGNTLLVVTADHATGGLTLIGQNKENSKFEYNFSTDDHSASMVPVYAFGPASDRFMGTYDNTHIGKTLIDLLK
jgi:alkaline phosphatase